MKKLLCLLMVLSLCSGSLFFVSAKEESVEANESFKIVSAIGVFDKGILPGSEIMRGEAVKIALRLAGMGEFDADSSKQVFSDVPANSKYAAAVNAAYSAGFINGTGGNLFQPDIPVTVSSMLKLIVTAMGYKLGAENKGGYSDGYMSIAHSKGLTKNVDMKGIFSYNELAEMIVNSFDVKLMETASYGGENITISESEKTILDNLNVQEIEGIVTQNTLTGFNVTNSDILRFAAIDGIYVVPGETEIDSLLGCKVRAYVRATDDSAERMLLYVAPYNNSTITISADLLESDDTEYSLEKIVYSESDGKRKELKISAEADFVYNNIVSLEKSREMLSPESGSLTLIDNNRDNIYDVVRIEECQNMLVESIVQEPFTIYDKHGEKLYLDEDNADIVIIEDVNGNVVDASVLSEWSVISVYDSSVYNSMANMRVVKIVVSEDVISGRITAKKDDAEGLYYTIGEIEYKVCSELLNAKIVRTAFPKLGDEGNFYLTANNEIIGFQIGSLEKAMNEFGFLVDCENEKGLSQDIFVKIFTTDGKTIVYEVAERITLDGNKIDREKLFSKFAAGEVERDIIRFRINENEKIYKIDTKNGDEAPDSIRKVRSKEEGKLLYKTGWRSFDSRFYVDSSTVFFRIPVDEDGNRLYDDISIMKMNFFENDGQYAFDAYTDGEYKLMISALVYESNVAKETNLANTFFIEKIQNIRQENGYFVQMAQGYDYSGSKTYYSESDAFSLNGAEIGDLVLCTANSEGYIEDIEILLDASDIRNHPTSFTGYIGGISFNNVYLRDGNLIAYVSDETDISAVVNVHDLEVTNLSLYQNIVNYDVQNETVRKASNSDIIEYLSDNTNFSLVVWTGGDHRFMVIYNNF